MSEINLLIVFLAGLASFFSPCVLPLLPGYLGYISGFSIKEIEESKEARRKVLFASLFFILGFTLIFVLLGMTISSLSYFLFTKHAWFERIGGLVLMIFGLSMTGLIKIPFLQKEFRFKKKLEKAGYFKAFLFGLIFAFAWSPCIGPILGSVLVLTASTTTIVEGVLFLTVYSLGISIPFFISSLVLGKIFSKWKKVLKYAKWIRIFSGAALFVFGLLLLTGTLSEISTILERIYFNLNIEFLFG